MYRGRTSFPTGMAFGHEITGEVVEVGTSVHVVKVGDWVSVPFNISCGTCKNCKARKTSACLTTNPKMPGGAYGSVTHNSSDLQSIRVIDNVDVCTSDVLRSILMQGAVDCCYLFAALPIWATGKAVRRSTCSCHTLTSRR